MSTQIPPRSPRSRKRREHAWLCHLLASTHPRLRLRRPGRGLVHPPQHRPSTRPPHPTARRTRLLRHPEQDRVGRSPAVIHFTECLRSVGVICRPASSTVPGWKTGPSTTRPIPATSSGRSSSHCCRRRGAGGRPEKHPRRLRDVPTQPSGRCDETGSAALSTNTWRSHEVTRFSAPTPGARPSAARRCRTTG